MTVTPDQRQVLHLLERGARSEPQRLAQAAAAGLSPTRYYQLLAQLLDAEVRPTSAVARAALVQYQQRRNARSRSRRTRVM